MCVPHWKGTTCDESRKSFQNRNAVRLIFHRQPVTHSSLIWSYEREREVLLVLLMSVSWRETTALTCWSSDRTNLTLCQLEKNNRAGSTVRWIFFVIFHPQFPPKYQVLCIRELNSKCFPVLNLSTDDKGKNVFLELLYSSTEWEMLSCTQPPSTEINCCLQPRWGQICYSNQPPGPPLLTVWRGWNLLLSSSVISHLASNE